MNNGLQNEISTLEFSDRRNSGLGREEPPAACVLGMDMQSTVLARFPEAAFPVPRNLVATAGRGDLQAGS